MKRIIFAAICLIFSGVAAFAAPTFTAPAGYQATEYLSMTTETLIEAFNVDATGNVYYVVHPSHDENVPFIVDVSTVSGKIVAGVRVHIGFQEPLIVVPQGGKVSRREGKLDRDDTVPVGAQFVTGA